MWLKLMKLCCHNVFAGIMHEATHILAYVDAHECYIADIVNFDLQVGIIFECGGKYRCVVCVCLVVVCVCVCVCVWRGMWGPERIPYASPNLFKYRPTLPHCFANSFLKRAALATV